MATIHQRELSSIMSVVFQPSNYRQKEIAAKLFVMRWALASGIDLGDSNDSPDEIRWCK